MRRRTRRLIKTNESDREPHHSDRPDRLKRTDTMPRRETEVGPSHRMSEIPGPNRYERERRMPHD
jgi:hypothetical protein